MITLKNLVQAIIMKFDSIAYDSYDSARELYDVEVLNENSIPDASTLYLLPDNCSPELLYKCLNKGFFDSHETFILFASKQIDLQSFPFTRILFNKLPATTVLYPFLRQTMKLEALLETQTNHLYHKMYSKNGLSEIVNCAEQYLKKPISVLDASYNLIETSPLMKNLEYGIGKDQFHMFLKSEEIESLKRLQIEDQIYKESQAFCIHSPDHPEDTWIFCGIRIRNVIAGYVAVCLVGTQNATTYELRFTTSLSTVCALEMQRQDRFTTQTGLKYERFLIQLLENHYSDIDTIRSRMSLLDYKFYNHFCLIVLKSLEPNSNAIFNKHQISTLRSLYPNSLSVVHNDAIVLLLNQESNIFLDSDFEAQIMSFVSRNHMHACFSQPFTDISKIHEQYQQALQCLIIGEHAYPGQSIFFSSELLPYYLFDKCSKNELETGIHVHIRQLIDYDKEYRTEFITTLRAYLANNRNAAQAAEVLHIHRSTFFYRIKKIEELLNISLTDSNLLFLYEISFRVMDWCGVV